MLLHPLGVYLCKEVTFPTSHRQGTPHAFVSGQEGEEEASHLGSSPPLFPSHGPSSYLSTYQETERLVRQGDSELPILLPLPPECWSQQILKWNFFVQSLKIPNVSTMSDLKQYLTNHFEKRN